jgi:hypothetical protein
MISHHSTRPETNVCILSPGIGGVPPDARYGPPDDKLVLEIISGTGPIFQQLDEEYAATATA